ncbi:DEAD-box ATP-dependent RNA helicase 15-like isoform X2 [Coffea arabica]|uniref:DEAD-box ATP-dependent RNA helicase 15-like isoform X2 n=1 Tax=Coffea arabica TaxID=13443 RepID=A0A6P6SAF4_COFAR|nr:DEAD-box ATP-dependent RNA helicase 56-like isoform X2 [Coffea arabica]
MRSSLKSSRRIMGETKENDAYEEELLDYEEDGEKAPDSVIAKVNGESVKRGYVRTWYRQLRIPRLATEATASACYCGFWV